jgi:hypothetical protein
MADRVLPPAVPGSPSPLPPAVPAPPGPGRDRIARGTEQPATPDADTAAPQPGPHERFRRCCAVVIAIDAYGGTVPPLRSAVRDATAVAEVLRADHGFDVDVRLDAMATAVSIADLLERDLPQRLGADDRLLVYFAGHGVAHEADDGPAGYLLLADAVRTEPASFLSMKRFHDALDALPCRHVLVVLDCCFAGSFRWSSVRDVIAPTGAVYRERYDRFVTSPAWQVLTSAAYDQTSLDTLHAERGESAGGHSPFASALLAGLQGAADLSGDGLITASELAVYLRDRVEPTLEILGREQTPQLFPLNRHRRGEFVFQVPGRPLQLPAAPPLTEDGNPYQGLIPFGQEDHDRFFGRDRAIAALAAAIDEQPIVLAVGPSGAGKSSLVAAGVSPTLQARDGWLVLPVGRPGSDPSALIASWRSALARHGLIAAGNDVPWESALAAMPPTFTRVLLVIDQLEDLFVHRAGADHTAAFLAAIDAAVTVCPALRVVAAVRSEVEPRLASGVPEHWRTATRFPVVPMDRDELRAVIEGPAAASVIYFDPPSLVDRLIDDVAIAPAKLPLLSFALQEMYVHFWHRHADDRAVRFVDYEAIGSVAAALTGRAEKVYDEIATSPELALTTRNVLVRMVTTIGARLARRRVRRDDFDTGITDEDARIDNVIRGLVAARLVVTTTEVHDGATVDLVEPAHDELILGWPRIGTWLEARPLLLDVGRELEAAAATWDRRDRSPTMLWHGDVRLAELRRLLAEPGHGLNRVERAFAEASVRRRRRRIATAAATVSGVIVALATIAGVALWQRSIAEDRLDAGYQGVRGMFDVIDEQLEPIAGAQEARSALLLAAGRLLQEIAPEPAEDDIVARAQYLSTRTRTAIDHIERGQVEGRQELQDAAEAAAALAGANVPQVLSTVRFAFERRGILALRENDLAGARHWLERALGVAERMYQLDPGDTTASILAAALDNLAQPLLNHGDLAGAEALNRRSLALLEEWLPRTPKRDEYLESIATSHAMLGDIAARREDRGAAGDEYDAALANLGAMNPDARRRLDVRRRIVELGGRRRRVAGAVDEPRCIDLLRDVTSLLIIENDDGDRRLFDDILQICSPFPPTAVDGTRRLARELVEARPKQVADGARIDVALGKGLAHAGRRDDASRLLTEAARVLAAASAANETDDAAREAQLTAYDYLISFPGSPWPQIRQWLDACLAAAADARWRDERAACLAGATEAAPRAARIELRPRLAAEHRPMMAAAAADPFATLRSIRLSSALIMSLMAEGDCPAVLGVFADIHGQLEAAEVSWPAEVRGHIEGLRAIVEQLRIQTRNEGCPR